MGDKILGCRGRCGGPAATPRADEIGERVREGRRWGRKAEARSRRRGSRSAGSLRQVDGQGPDGSMWSSSGWSLIGIMMAVRLVTSPTCSLVVGPGAQARMCHRREESFGLCRLLGRSCTARRNLTGHRPLPTKHAATPIVAIVAIGGGSELRRPGCSSKPPGIAPRKSSRSGTACTQFHRSRQHLITGTAQGPIEEGRLVHGEDAAGASPGSGPHKLGPHR